MSTHNTPQFLDQVQLTFESGHGGAGAVSFRREAMTPRGGPDGGDGGRGGNVILRASRKKSSLIDFSRKKHFLAENGQPGQGANMFGRAGQDLVVEVPVGTLVLDQNGNLLRDLKIEQDLVLLEGGRGGKGNSFFRTSVNQAPDHAQPGEDGEILPVQLELKLIADVGIIGFPNAGKSTLISRVSAAKPKIANYPFTTLVPHLGVVSVGDEDSFVLADIPGLIPGAHKGVGLGLQFLKHVERTRVLIHLIDVSDEEMVKPWEKYQSITEELHQYDELSSRELFFGPLSKRPEIVVFNKIEVLPAERIQKLKKDFVKKIKITPLLISAVTGQNLESLKFHIWDLLKQERISQ